ncbi:cysteine dioxygenase [Mangrovibacterium lignilyticum]|uniref:cysteine dioxygenase n=1 Tax=Mangrovibacterium lignilyticum TaxID=2668052 RepID=UPI0013D29E0E|nr:cysteine dioxygenase family protein [Mangrovibacterium lignilyticum]
MKDLFNTTTNESNRFSGVNFFHYSNRFGNSFELTKQPEVSSHKIHPEELLTPNAFYQMSVGQIPNLWAVCLDLATRFQTKAKKFTVSDLVQFMTSVPSLDQEEVKRFVRNSETHQVLVNNDQFKILLIHWKPGETTSIHGHNGTECVFKLLQGKLEELRHTPDREARLLSSSSYLPGSIGYLNDQMAYHQVGNPYGTSAISLHVYLK